MIAGGVEGNRSGEDTPVETSLGDDILAKCVGFQSSAVYAASRRVIASAAARTV